MAEPEGMVWNWKRTEQRREEMGMGRAHGRGRPTSNVRFGFRQAGSGIFSLEGDVEHFRVYAHQTLRNASPRSVGRECETRVASGRRGA